VPRAVVEHRDKGGAQLEGMEVIGDALTKECFPHRILIMHLILPLSNIF
jgi:hypothetical protein